MEQIFGSGPKIEKGSSLDANQTELANKVKDLLSGGLGKESQQYSGQYAANQTGGQTAALGVLNKLLSDPNATALGSINKGTPVMTDSVIRDSIVNPNMKLLREETLPMVGEAFSGNGTYWSSDRAKAQTKAINDTTSNIASKIADVQYQSGENAANRALQGLSTTGALSGSLYGMGAQGQATEQTALDRAYEEWVRTRPENSNFLAAAMQYLNTPMMYALMNQGTPGILGPAAQAAGTLFSDRRLKTKLVKGIQLVPGIHVYDFEFVFDPGSVVTGVMADEVKKVFPSCVTVHDSGYDMVNYDLLAKKVSH